MVQALKDSKHAIKTLIAVEDEANTAPIPGGLSYSDFTKYTKDTDPTFSWTLSIYDETS